MKRAGSQVAINAREAVRFLDRVTSGKDNTPTDRVVLQGPMEQYENWEDAEQFFLPEYEEEPEPQETNGAVENAQVEQPPSDGEKSLEKDDMSQLLLSKLNFQKDSDAASMASNRTSSGPPSRQSSKNSRTSRENASPLANGAANQGSVHRRSESGSVIPTAPLSLRPLLSALLWRLHNGPDASNAAKACILITNDRTTQVWAQKFGIGTKNIQQLRTSIQYEEREYKNRCKYVEKTQGVQPEPKTLLSYDEESDEDELVFVPRGRGKAVVRGSSRGAHRKTTPAKPVPVQETDVPSQPIDPNSFSRSLGPNTTTTTTKPAVEARPQPIAGTGTVGSRGSPSARRGPRGVTRGRGGRGGGRLWVP